MEYKKGKSYWLEAIQYKHELDSLRAYNDSLRRSLEVFQKKSPKKFSGQFLLLNEKDGKFFDPVIVTADGAEEALCDNSGVETHNFALPIPDVKEFKEF